MPKIDRDIFLRSLQVSERLAAADPQAQRDIFVSLDNLGNIEIQASNHAAARDLLLRSLDIAQRLASDSQDATAAFDVVISLTLLGRLAREQGDHASELEHLRRAHALLSDMNARGHIQGFAQREWLLHEITTRLSSLDS